MASEQLTVVSCDVCGKRITGDRHHEHEITIDGTMYELDLCPGDARDFDRWVTFVQNHGTPRRSTSAKRPATSAAAMRAWLQAEGYDIGDRGRIPAVMQDAYAQRHRAA